MKALPFIIGAAACFLFAAKKSRAASGAMPTTTPAGGERPDIDNPFSTSTNTGDTGAEAMGQNLPDWNPTPPTGYKRYAGAVDAEITAAARTALSQPYGSWNPFTHSDGREMGILLERHYHEPGGPLHPWGPHKGSSVFVKA
jgi:hypothetical protein